MCDEDLDDLDRAVLERPYAGLFKDCCAGALVDGVKFHMADCCEVPPPTEGLA